MNIEFEDDITPEEAREVLRAFDGVQVVDNPEEDQFITPIDCAGEWATFVSRIRRDTTVEHGLSMWVVSDNLRKGAALNAVQIGEELIKRGVLQADLPTIPA